MRRVIFAVIIVCLISLISNDKMNAGEGLTPLERELKGTSWQVSGDTMTLIRFDTLLCPGDRWPGISMKKPVGLNIKTESIKSAVKVSYKKFYEEGYFCVYHKDSVEIFVREQDYDYYYVGKLKKISKYRMEFAGSSCSLGGDYEKILFIPYKKVKMIFVKKQ